MVSKTFFDDPRGKWDRLTRRQIRKGMKKLNIPYSQMDNQDQLVDICLKKGITPEQLVRFEPVRVEGPNGQEKIVLYPQDNGPRERTEQEEMQRAMEWERRMEEAESRVKAEEAAKLNKKDNEITQLKEQISQLTEIVKNLDRPKVKKPKSTDPFLMKYLAQRSWLKKHGVEHEKGQSVNDLIQMVIDRDYNGENPSTGNQRGTEES